MMAQSIVNDVILLLQDEGLRNVLVVMLVINLAYLILKPIRIILYPLFLIGNAGVVIIVSVVVLHALFVASLL